MLSLEQRILSKLQKNAQTLATAESCTGGYVAHCLTNVSGASLVFLQGFITYSNLSKSILLGIVPTMLERYGAVSQEVAMAMAEGVQKISKSTFGLATTGVAGPTGGSEQTPVGTCFLAIAQEGRATLVWREFFSAERLLFKEQVTESLFLHLEKILSKEQS